MVLCSYTYTMYRYGTISRLVLYIYIVLIPYIHKVYLYIVLLYIPCNNEGALQCISLWRPAPHHLQSISKDNAFMGQCILPLRHTTCRAFQIAKHIPTKTSTTPLAKQFSKIWWRRRWWLSETRRDARIPKTIVVIIVIVIVFVTIVIIVVIVVIVGQKSPLQTSDSTEK